MSYRIICYTDGKEYPLLDERDEDYSLAEARLVRELNKTGSLTMTIPECHPNYSAIKKLVSTIKVFRVQPDGSLKWLYSGRSLTDETDFYNTGTVECEGILAFLLDSIVREYSWAGPPAEYVELLISEHNAHVDARKQFRLGNISVEDVDSNNLIVRESTQFPDTLSELSKKVAESLECYISARDENNALYFDCIQELPTNSQVVRYGENILDLNQKNSAADLKTVLIGIGAEDASGNRIQCTIERGDAIAEFGRIEGTVEFFDVTLMENLEKKTASYLDKLIGFAHTVEVSAVDLNMVDEEIEALDLGWVQVEAEPQNLNAKMLLSKIDLDLLNPENCKLTLGLSEMSYTASQIAGLHGASSAASRALEGVNALNQKKYCLITEVRNVDGTAAAVTETFTENGRYLLRAYNSKDALLAVYEYLFSGHEPEGGTWAGKAAATTGAISNTYGTVAVNATAKGLNVKALKGYRIEVTVNSCFAD